MRDCKVLDFGVSKLTVADAATTGDITLSGNVVGTPEYMAPEQVRAGKHADHRIDIYSLGVVFYEMLAGRPPFVGEHFSGLMLDIMQRDPPPLRTLRTDVPRRLAGVIHRALARDLDRRYADMPTYIMAVEAVGRDELKLAMGTPAGGPDHAARDAAADAGRAAPDPKDRRGVQVAIAVGLGLAAAGTWLWIDMRPGSAGCGDTAAAVERAHVARAGPNRRRAASRAARRASPAEKAVAEKRWPRSRERAAPSCGCQGRSTPGRAPDAPVGRARRGDGQAPTKGSPSVVIPAKASSSPSNRGTELVSCPSMTFSEARRPAALIALLIAVGVGVGGARGQ